MKLPPLMILSASSLAIATGVHHLTMGSQVAAAAGMNDGVCCCCRATLDEAASASYELTDAEYATNEAEDTWVDHLLGILVAMLQWLQPLLTPSNYDALVASLLQKARRHLAGLPLSAWRTGCACSLQT